MLPMMDRDLYLGQLVEVNAVVGKAIPKLDERRVLDGMIT